MSGAPEDGRSFTGVSLAGLTLATILHAAAAADAVASASACADGLLLGSVTERLSARYDDDAAEPSAAFAAEREAHVTSVLLLPRPMSFYDAAGAVQLDRLRALLAGATHAGGELLGWLSLRPSGRGLTPSMREAAVTASLGAHLGGRPAVFGLVAPRKDAAAPETHTTDYMFTQGRTGSSPGSPWGPGLALRIVTLTARAAGGAPDGWGGDAAAAGDGPTSRLAAAGTAPGASAAVRQATAHAAAEAAKARVAAAALHAAAEAEFLAACGTAVVVAESAAGPRAEAEVLRGGMESLSAAGFCPEGYYCAEGA